MNRLGFATALLVTFFTSPALCADEAALAWESFAGERVPAAPPFTCDLDGRPASLPAVSDQDAERWKARDEEPCVRRSTSSSAVGPAGGVRAEFRYASYPQFTAVEWLPRLSNEGTSDSPILSDLRSGDFILPADAGASAAVHYSDGSAAAPTDFHPRRAELAVTEPLVLRSQFGRSSEGVLPYFNVRLANNRGAIVAVGWTGDWQAIFERTDTGVRVRVGLAHGHFFLKPGESVRLPSVVVLFYEGDWLDGQNRWRRFMRTHLTPAAARDGAALPVAASPHLMVGFNDQSEANMLPIVDAVRKAQLPVDTFWIDAGWNAGGFPASRATPSPTRTATRAACAPSPTRPTTRA